MKDQASKKARLSLLLACAAMILCFFTSGLLPACAMVILCVASIYQAKQARSQDYQGPLLYYALILDIISLIILIRWIFALAMSN